ncbi:Tub family-domain-containing protein [Powellomyces hirtus]|nr:Tub family-domain-containing protein [Powellomyces hirtus]
MPVDTAQVRSSNVEGADDELESQIRDLKRELKEWERAFASKEGRKPEKPDILADKAIARRYKAYIKLKASTDGGGGKKEGRDLGAKSSKSSKSRSRPDASGGAAASEGVEQEEPEIQPVPPSASKVSRSEARREAKAPRVEEPVNEVDGEPSNDRDNARSNRSSLSNRHTGSDNSVKATSVKDTLTDSGSDEQINSDAVRAADVVTPADAAGDSRPWGGAAALPENFMLRRNTVASGPISTATLSMDKPAPRNGSISRGSIGTESRARPVSMSFANRPVSASSMRPVSLVSGGNVTTTTTDSDYDNLEASEFMNFMNRKKEIEGQAAAPAGAVSAAEALRLLQQQQQQQQQSAANSSSAASTLKPIVTAITVQAPKPAPSPFSPMTATPAPEPLTAAQLRELAKPYDPDEDEDFFKSHDNDAEPDTPLHAVGQRIAAVPRKKKHREPKPPPRATLAFAAPEGEDDEDEEEEEEEQKVVEEEPKPPKVPKKDRDRRKETAKQEEEKPVEQPDEDEEAEKGEGIAPMTATANAPGTMCFGADAIGVATNPSLVGVKIFFRLPPEFILRCKLYRKKNILDKSHPTFYLYNQADESFLLAARKRKKSKSVNYVISSSQLDMSKDSKHYVAKLKANFQRTNFVLLDARSYNPRTENKGFRELACISYTKTVLPREMSVAIPATSITELSDDYSKDIMSDVKTQNTDKLLFLRNKPPRWNEATQSHCLNFGGRVTQPSIKNCQLIGSENENFVVMQFGRCGPDYFTLDVRYPMTPLEAFAVALTTFDAYDNA